MRVEVDLELCQGYANCVLAAPEVFELSDDGLSAVIDESPGEDQRAAVEEAVRTCPVRAIHLED